MKKLVTLSLFAGLLLSGASGWAQTFAGHTDYPATGQPQAALVADANADGQPDLVALSAGADGKASIGVQYGRGDGTFAASVAYAAGTPLRALAVGDVNNDSRPDLVGIGTTLTVLLGQSGGGFGSPLSTPLAGEARLLQLRDMDGDGTLDVVTSLFRSEAVVVLPGLGTGSFGPASTYAVGGDVIDLRLAEVTQDRVVDLVVISQRFNAAPVACLAIFPGLRSGGFGTRSIYPLTSLTDSRPTVLELANINGDTYLDALVVDAAAQRLSVWLGLNTGGFEPRVDYQFGADQKIRGVAGGDVDGDGAADVLLADSAGSAVRLLPGSRTGKLGASVPYGTGAGPVGVALADVNADGRLDAVTANVGRNDLSVLLNASRTPSTAPVINSLSAASGFAGNMVYILGNKLDNIKSVRFGGVESRYFTSAFSTTLWAMVPAGARTGPVTVTNANGTATSASPFTVASLPADSYVISNLSLTTCGGTLYDSGGPVATSHISDSYQQVLTPATPGTKMRLTFTSFDLDTGFDNLYIYDGDNTNCLLLGTYTGTTSPGTVTATNTKGQLTLVFAGNSGFPKAGFAATMACAGTPGLLVASTTPAGASTVAAPASVAVTFAGAAPTAASAGTIKVFSSQSGGRRALGAATVAGTTATLPLPGDALKAGETVQVVVPATVRSAGGAAAVPYAFQFTTATVPSVGVFGARSDYATGTYPVSVSLGDMTGDGRLDLVSANQKGTTISVQPGLATGDFGPKVDYAVGSSPTGLALGDLNNDGRLDVVVTNKNTSQVSVLLATAAGAFAPFVSYTAAATPVRVTLGDINGDGYLDMVVASDGILNLYASGVQVYLNTGTGTFGAYSYIFTGPNPSDVALGDFNEDGVLDIVTPNSGGLSVSIALGMGGGKFRGAEEYKIGAITSEIALGDFNGDGHLDIVTVGQTAGRLMVMTGSGRGTFTTSYPYSNYSYSSADVKVGDLNGDGLPDIVSAASSDETLSVLFNKPGGGFESPVAYYAGGAGIALGDIDGDGRLDIAEANPVANTVGVWLNVPPPAILSFDPASGVVGTKVTIKGNNFRNTSQIKLNGVSVGGFGTDFIGTTLTFTVPAGASSGPIAVTTPGGTAVSAMSFTVLAPQLTVGQGGTPYASNGAVFNFGSQQVGAVATPVLFTLTNSGSTPLAFTSIVASPNFSLRGSLPTAVLAGSTATVAVAFVPTTSGLLTGTLSLVSELGTYTVKLAGTGTYAAPIITSFTPATGAVSTVVTVTGSGFLVAGTTVTLNGVVLTGVVVSADGTSLTFPIPPGAGAGPIVVATAGGTARSSQPLCVQYTPTATPASRCGAGPLTLLAAGAPAGAGTYVWYATATGGAPLAGASGATYTSSVAATATYYVAISTGTGADACEGPRTPVVATINSIPAQPVITQGPAGTLTSSSATGNQWYLNGVALAGATGPSYTIGGVAPAGTYTLVVTSPSGCASAPSAGLVVVVTAARPPSGATALQVVPNPAYQACVVQVPATSGVAAGQLMLRNELGQTVRLVPVGQAAGARVSLDLTGLAPGVYLVQWQAGATTLTQRLMVE